MPYRVAILWRGDCEARRAATPQHNRYHRIFEELAVLGIRADPAVFDEEFADEVHEQLLTLDGVLVWVDPISSGKTRTVLNAILRDVAARGPWVSAHPDVIMKMGVKEALHRSVTTCNRSSPASRKPSGWPGSAPTRSTRCSPPAARPPYQ